MSDIEAQGGPYQDDPEFDSLSDGLADSVFDITAANGRLWALLKGGKLEDAVDLVTDNRLKFRHIRQDIEKLQQWSAPLPAQRFTQHKITREFSEAFTEFQRIQKALADKERGAIQEAQQALKEDFKKSKKAKASNESGIQLQQQQQQQQFQEQLDQDEISYQQGLIQEREEEIQGIESGINELSEIFTNLSTVIAEQGTVLDNIETNMYSVAQNTRDGSGQLTKAARWQRRASGRQLCFLLILLVLAAVIILSVLAG